jgi:two-component system, OmpR family, copper resistance phosphate regulon response regulator CusR
MVCVNSTVMRVLLAEDQTPLAERLRDGMVANGFTVDIAADGDTAVHLAENNTYDVMLLDVMTPGRDGFAVVEYLRNHNILTPVMFITGRDGVEDRVRGLDAGGDDYLVKPFSISEMLARVRALLRRQRMPARSVRRVADLELDLVSRCAQRGGRKIPLTGREFALLDVLMASAPKPVSKATLMEHIWQQQADSHTNVVNVYIRHLRRKIDQPGLSPLLRTVRGAGFALQERAAAILAIA